MKPSNENSSFAVPSALLAQVQAAADEERRSTAEIVQEALEGYLDNRRWQRLFDYGETQARKSGLTQEDVPRLVAEYREERRRGQ